MTFASKLSHLLPEFVISQEPDGITVFAPYCCYGVKIIIGVVPDIQIVANMIRDAFEVDMVDPCFVGKN